MSFAHVLEVCNRKLLRTNCYSYCDVHQLPQHLFHLCKLRCLYNSKLFDLILSLFVPHVLAGFWN